MPTRPVAVIIGMMGAGKTRVGKEVAQLMSLPFADADVEIEHEVGMRIPEYFERHGEPAFREVESEVIAGMLHGFGGVFALGGGAPMTPAVQDDLKEYIEDGGKVVYLMADPREAMERAHRGGGPADAAGGRQCPLEEAVPPARPSVLPGGERPCRNIRADAARRGEEDDGYDYRTNGSCDRRDHRGL